MAQEVPVAGLAGPVAVGDRGVGTGLAALAEGSKQLQTNRLKSDVREAADAAGQVADRTRQGLEAGSGQFSSGTDAGESAGLLSQAEGTTADELLAQQGNAVGERARRVFGRYRTALSQGATNATAARISVEKEMQSLISANPAYADVIRSEAASAMGQTEFNLLIRDRESQPGGATTSQFQKDLSSVYDAVDAMPGWSKEYKAQKKLQLQQDLAEKYMVENTNELFASLETNDENTSRIKTSAIGKEISLSANEIMGNGLDLIASNGGLADDGTIPFLGEEQMAQIQTNIDQKINDYRLQLENSIPRTLPEEQRQQTIEQHLKPLTGLADSLRKQSASEALGLVYKAQNLGMKLSMNKAFPLLTAAQETFGANAEYFLNMMQDDPMSSLAFQNSAYTADLQSKVETGLISREEIPGLLVDYVGKNVQAATSGGEPDWEFLSQYYIGHTAANVPRSKRNEDEQYGDVIEQAAANSPADVAKNLVGTTQVDKHQRAAAQTWHTAVQGASQQEAKRLQRDNANPEQRQSYVSATRNPDGKISVMKYTAVAATDENGNPTWRVSGGVPIRGVSSGINSLTTRYGIGNGKSRSVVEHPELTDMFYGDTSAEYLENVIGTINGNTPAPEWLPALAQRGANNMYPRTVAEQAEGGQQQPAVERPRDAIDVVQDYGEAIMDYTPAGWVIQAGQAVGEALFGGGEEEPAAPQQQPQGQAEVVEEAPASGLTTWAEGERAQLETDEGTKKNDSGEHISYVDTEGHLTGGIGHLMTAEEKKKYPEGTAIPEDVVNDWYEQDLKEAEADVESYIESLDTEDKEYPEEVKKILTNLLFNMGSNRFSKKAWPGFSRALEEKDYDAAADELIDSKWYRQVKTRSKRLVKRMRAVGTEE